MHVNFMISDLKDTDPGGLNTSLPMLYYKDCFAPV